MPPFSFVLAPSKYRKRNHVPMDGILEVPEYIPPYGWRYKGARISEEEAESICRDLGIPFCIERGAVENTFLIRTAIAGTQFVEGFEELTSEM